MSAIPLRTPASIVVEGATLHPDPNTCFACTPPYKHVREWHPDPNAPGRHRTLVLCFDGTGDSFDQDNSNVVQFLSMLKKDDPTNQLVYYQAGIGTYTGNGVVGTPIIQKTSKLLDEMIAWNLPEHIKDGYEFLMQNYHVGDHICIFGFSRGAFTARALAGMLQKVGLLPPCNVEQLPFAYSMYAKNDEESNKLSLQFKRTFSIDVKIQFLGVWDTVQSVGLIPKHLPFSGTNNAIVYFRHALALDEHRVKFIPFYCALDKPKQKSTDAKLSDVTSEASHHHHKIERRERSGGSGFEAQANFLTGPDTDVQEVFFSGAHCDIGGGSVGNDEPNSLARIPLRWMIRECFNVNSGIIFDVHMLRNELGFDINTISKPPKALSPASNQHLVKPGRGQIKGFTFASIPRSVVSGLSSPFRWGWDKLSHLRLHDAPVAQFSFDLPKAQCEDEAREELKDALSPIYDQLNLHWYWKPMEWVPWVIKKQSAEVADYDGRWAYKFIWNFGNGREVYRLLIRRGVKVHRSVKTRILAQPVEGEREQYLPKIRFPIDGKVRTLTREEWLANPPTHFEWVDEDRA